MKGRLSMNYYVKQVATLLFAFLIAIGLSGCGTSLQKPSGLEDSTNQQTAVDKIQRDQT